MIDHDHPYPPGEPERYVYIERPRCPVCWSADLKTRKSMRDEDDSITRDTLCRCCGWVFFVVVE